MGRRRDRGQPGARAERGRDRGESHLIRPRQQRRSEATEYHLTKPIVKVQVLSTGVRRLERGRALDMARDTHPIEDLRRGRYRVEGRSVRAAGNDKVV